MNRSTTDEVYKNPRTSGARNPNSHQNETKNNHYNKIPRVTVATHSSNKYESKVTYNLRKLNEKVLGSIYE